eukprot:205727-Chlamydomonas_euryale.AAC.1
MRACVSPHFVSHTAAAHTQVGGRPLKIGRPKGYEEQYGKMMTTQKLNMAQTFAAQLSGAPTNVVQLEGLTSAKLMLDPTERRE